jgi:hypothetical protein
VEAALRRYGAVVGLTFGAYGEQSKALKEVRHLVARKHAAASWRAMGAVSEEVVYSYMNRRLRAKWAQTAMREMARLRLRRLPFVGRAMEVGATVAPEGRMAEALRGDGVGSAADFSASGTDGGGGNGPHGRDGGRVALPSGPWASV